MENYTDFPVSLEAREFQTFFFLTSGYGVLRGSGLSQEVGSRSRITIISTSHHVSLKDEEEETKE